MATKVKRKKPPGSQKKEEITLRRSWSERSGSEKVMIVLSLLIALSMVLALFGQVGTNALG